MQAGGRSDEVAAPFDEIPLHVRAGSILPLGPELQYSDEKPADPITLYVYAGADGNFTLYEDDGISYAFERGQSTRITLHWDDGKRVLNIAAREGSFPGMPSEREFQVVLIDKLHPLGFAAASPASRSIRYNGAAQSLGF